MCPFKDNPIQRREFLVTYLNHILIYHFSIPLIFFKSSCLVGYGLINRNRKSLKLLKFKDKASSSGQDGKTGTCFILLLENNQNQNQAKSKIQTKTYERAVIKLIDSYPWEMGNKGSESYHLSQLGPGDSFKAVTEWGESR